MPKKQFESTYFKFVQVANKVEEQIKQPLKSNGLTHAQLNVLHLLNVYYPKSLNLKDIREKLIVRKPDMSRLIDRLEKKEFIERKICETNRRMVDVRITHLGRQIFKSSNIACKKSVGNFFEDYLEEEEARQLFKLLNKIEL